MQTVVRQILALIFLLGASQLFSQCVPPAADTCQQANVLCSLAEVDGYKCKNTDKDNYTGCNPLCPQGGVANNTSWWAFVSGGGNVCITINVSNCSVNNIGVQMGIYGNCDCTDTVRCFSECNLPGSIVICGTLDTCKIYYLFVDGCVGDVCDIELKTNGAGQGKPVLPPIKSLNGPRAICAGACDLRYSITQDPSVCRPKYIWTIDSVDIKKDSAAISLEFKTVGNFVLCISEEIGTDASVCAKVDQVCDTIRVTQAPIRNGMRYLCFEDVPYQWNALTITTSGVYMQQFKENCCGIDSVVNFIILPKPLIPKIYFLSCDGDKYIDPTTNLSFTICQNGTEVKLNNSTQPFLCDSSYLLYATFLNIGADLKEFCQGGKIILSSEVIDSTCIIDSYATLKFDYLWYLKSDATKSSIGIDTFIVIKSKDNYCVDITISGQLDNVNKKCTFTFCENIDENQFKQNQVCPKGNLQYCRGEKGSYTTDTIFPNNVKHVWTVTNGTINTLNPDTKSTIDITWDFNPGAGLPYIGKICYHYESDCPPSPECCIEVNVQPYPTPSAGPDKSVCGKSIKLSGSLTTGNGTWTQLSGPPVTIVPAGSATPDVTVTNFGVCVLVLTETRFGCTATDTVKLNFYETPAKGNNTFICEPDQKSYTIKFPITGGTGPYKIIKGNGSIDVTNTYTSSLIPNLINDTIIIEDVNGCSFTYIQSHECQCSNEIGDISTVLQRVCADGVINVIYDASKQVLDKAPNKDTVIFFIYTDINNPLTSIIRVLNSNSFTYSPLFVFGTTYYIGARLGRVDNNGAIDISKGCLKLSIGTPFVFYEIPKPNAGLDAAVCSDNYNLVGFQSIAGSKISWREKNNKAVSFVNNSNAVTNVSILGGFGTYTFVLKEGNQDTLCVREDEVTITFNQNPDLINLDRFCVELGGGPNPGRYKAMIEIQNGKPPFSLVIPPSTPNGTINGKFWMSDTLTSLDSFIVRVRDANGCESQTNRNTYNCNCGPINAGMLDTNTIRTCLDSCIRVRDLIPEIINPAEDVVMYILHSSSYNNPASVLDTFYSKNDLICFDPKRMKFGPNNPYYITRVVGDDLSPKDGVVDITDICNKASNNMKIVFEPYPVPMAGADAKICGLTVNLNGDLTFGSANWTVLSSPPASNLNFADVTNTKTKLDVSVKGKYIFVLSGRNYNCTSFDTVVIDFFDSPEFIDNTIQFICDSIAENYKIIIDSRNGDRPSWSVSGKYFNLTKNLAGNLKANTNTWESAWIPTGNNFRIDIKDINNCNTDIFDSVFTCACLTKIGTLDLTPIILCQDACAKAIYKNAPGFLDPNDIVQYVLYDGQSNNPKGGTTIATNTTGLFCFDATKMTLGKTYYIAVFAGNRNPANGAIDFNDRCLVNTNGVPVDWYAYPQAKISGAKLLTCLTTVSDLDAGSSISGSGSPLKYKWSNGDSTALIKTNLPGTFTVTVIDSKSNCTNTSTIVIDRMVDLPKIIIDTPLKFTCSRLLVNINGNRSDNGANFQAFWKGNGITGGGNTYTASVNQPGKYTIVVENKITNCRDSVDVIVGTDTTPPMAKISQVGTLGCVIKEISLNGSQSTGSSGTISSYTWIGNVISGQGTSSIKIGSPGGRFILEVKDASNGCIDRDTILVNEEGNPLGEIKTSLKNPDCFGKTNGSITIDEVLDKSGLPLNGLQYSINSGPFVSSRTFNNLRSGNYTITVKDAQGCILSTINVIVEPAAIDEQVQSTIIVDQGTIVDIDTLLLSVSGGTTNAFGEYRDTTWLSVFDSVYLTNLVYQADTTREFIITTIDQSGCEVSKKVRVIVRIIKDVWWPSIFNPSSSIGENSRWNLYGKRVRNVRILNIYSRWGELVYSAQNFQDANKVKGLGWDGMVRGQKALPGVYAFYAEVEFENSSGNATLKGELTLVR